MFRRCLSCAVVVVLFLTGCGTSDGAGAERTAVWLAPILASEDPFFHAFAMSGPDSYWADDSEWACIALGVTRALDVPDFSDAYLQLSEMATSSHDSPLALKLEATSVFASLSEGDRVKMARAVLAVADDCGDVRLNLYGDGGAAAVCIYDRSSDDIHERIVAYSMLGRGSSVEEELFSEAWEVILECWSLLQQAEEDGIELPWLVELHERYRHEWKNRSDSGEG